MKRRFKKGDEVQLKTGGPVMNVVTYMLVSDIVAGSYLSLNEVVCTWDDPKKGKQTGIFSQDQLELAEKKMPLYMTKKKEKKAPLNS